MEVCRCMGVLTPPICHYPLNNFPGVVFRRRVTVVRVTPEDDTTQDSVSALNDIPTLDHVTQTLFTHSDDEQTLLPQSSLPFLDNLGVQLDAENLYQVLLYGGGSLVAIWLLSAVVGAVDSIPVVPQLLEVIGLGYSLWFTTRYLLFKKDREELSAKIEELKQEVIGTDRKGEVGGSNRGEK